MAVDRGAADPQRGRDRRHRVLPRAVHLLGHLQLMGGQHRGTAAVAAAGTGGSQPRRRALADQVTFKLGQRSEDVEDELAAGGGGVDGLLEAAEPNPAVGQAGDGVDQVPQGPAEPVQLQTRVSPERSWSRTWTRVGRSLRAPLAVSVNTR
jgi:hypothetical protein